MPNSGHGSFGSAAMPAEHISDAGAIGGQLRHRLALALCLAGAALLATAATAGARMSNLRLDQLQMLGSHNSYRPYPSAAERGRMKALDPAARSALEYGHPPLETQLALGIRQIEIDVVPDHNGGLYAAPYADADAATKAAMAAPGGKVLHIPGLDTETHCLTFRACLSVLAHWSDMHPGHSPLVVLVNTSDANGEKFDEAALAALDADLRTVIGNRRLITPDDVRAKRSTLRDAVLAHRWPTMAAAAGHLLFVLDSTDATENTYRLGHASLGGRAMFGYYAEGDPEASIFNIQDPRPAVAHIRLLVQRGFIVRTRADSGGVEARANDRSRLDAALASGAQWISTDWYDGVPDPQLLAYRVGLPGGEKTRCDPVVTDCRRARR